MYSVVLVAPGGVKVTEDEIANRGDNVTFMCSSKGGPNNYYQWLLNDTVLPGNSIFLNRTQVDATSGGSYTCIVKNIAGRDSSSLTLYIQPYITTFPVGYLEVELSDSVTFICHAEGFPAPVLSWVKVDGQMNGTIASTTGNLTFPSVAAEDNGTYICRATTHYLQTTLTTTNSVLIGTRQVYIYLYCV